MSKVSIYETGWLNLVFEGKNKAYGAYQLRQESPKTTLIAFFFGLFFIASISVVGLLLSSFGTLPTEEIKPFDRIIELSNIIPIAPEEPPLPPTQKKTAPLTEVTKQTDLTNNVTVTKAADANDIKSNIDPPAAPNPVPEGTDIGATGTTTTGTVTTTPGNLDVPVDPNVLVVPTALDVMPAFPGGIKKFYDYVGSTFEKPEIDETVSIFMSFVIEKDGSMSNIKVLRNPGYGLDKEAIRVLKSLRTKWKPGIKNGLPVRVLYTLPIKVTRS